MVASLLNNLESCSRTESDQANKITPAGKVKFVTSPFSYVIS